MVGVREQAPVAYCLVFLGVSLQTKQLHKHLPASACSLTPNYLKHAPRLLFVQSLSDVAPSKSLGKKDVFKKLGVKFVMFAQNMRLEFSVRNMSCVRGYALAAVSFSVFAIAFCFVNKYREQTNCRDKVTTNKTSVGPITGTGHKLDQKSCRNGEKLQQKRTNWPIFTGPLVRGSGVGAPHMWCRLLSWRLLEWPVPLNSCSWGMHVVLSEGPYIKCKATSISHLEASFRGMDWHCARGKGQNPLTFSDECDM